MHALRKSNQRHKERGRKVPKMKILWLYYARQQQVATPRYLPPFISEMRKAPGMRVQAQRFVSTARCVTNS
ncbi:hypothetical protein N7467_000006 [Penicillium canescens]|nr:hypothetical protein N7467_000006 [Penicillium canescens]